MFEKGKTESENDTEHNEQCLGGIARCCLKTGDIRRGVELALSIPNKQIKRECASILESIRVIRSDLETNFINRSEIFFKNNLSNILRLEIFMRRVNHGRKLLKFI